MMRPSRNRAGSSPSSRTRSSPRSKINISATSTPAMHINGLACAKVRCEITADFRHRAQGRNFKSAHYRNGRHPFSREWEKRATALKASALNKRSSRIAPATARRRDRVPRRFLQAPVRSELAEAPNASLTATAQEGSRLRSPSLPTQFFTTPESKSAAYWAWVKNRKRSIGFRGCGGLSRRPLSLPNGGLCWIRFGDSSRNNRLGRFYDLFWMAVIVQFGHDGRLRGLRHPCFRFGRWRRGRAPLRRQKGRRGWWGRVRGTNSDNEWRRTKSPLSRSWAEPPCRRALPVFGLALEGSER